MLRLQHLWAENTTPVGLDYIPYGIRLQSLRLENTAPVRPGYSPYGVRIQILRLRIHPLCAEITAPVG